MKKTFILSLFLSCGCGLFSAGAQTTADFHVVPLPQHIQKASEGDFVLNGKTTIVYPKNNQEMKRNAEFLAGYLLQHTGMSLKLSDKQVKSNAIILSLGLDNQNKEAYALSVSGQHISISGVTPAGVFYGIQTLRKAVPVEKTEQVTFSSTKIKDYPRFSYRGAHLDVSRHFFSVDSVKRFVDMLALHNINRFHWHLTDDQGWRIEMKKYPELITIGSKRTGTVIGHNSGKYDNIPYGGFYTQQEAKEIVKYAAERHITVIPEIDMPGHMQAALSAYPYLGCTGGPYEVWKQWGVSDNVLCAGNDQTLEFIDNILSEIIEIFPSEYIHVGGDECPKSQWAKCPKCQARIKALGLKSDNRHTAEERLQSFIINHAEKFLNSKGRQIIGWDEILEGGLAPNATVMSWRGSEGGIESAKQKHNAIMTPNSYLYFDYYQSADVEKEPMAIGGYLPLERVYSFEPVDKSLTPDEAKYIIGVQANLWTEYIPTFRQVEYMELPRMAALAETQWMMPDKKNYQEFLKRLIPLVHVYDAQHYNYAKHIFDVKAECTPDLEKGVQRIKLYTVDDAPIYYTLDGSEPSTSSLRYNGSLELNKTCTLKAAVIRPSGMSRVFEENFRFNKASLKPIKMLQPINKKYKYDGEITLIDGLSGGNGYNDGRWIAFYGNNMEAVIDLKKSEPVNKAWVRLNINIGDQVFDLRKFIVSVSDDGENFREVASENYPAITENYKNGIYVREVSFDSVNARYIKLTVVPEMNIEADWHYGKNSPAYLFIDEVGVE